MPFGTCLAVAHSPSIHVVLSWVQLMHFSGSISSRKGTQAVRRE
jgi:hypothetical protein